MTDYSSDPSQAEEIIPFTGYYTLDASTGSFVLVDTNFAYARAAPDVMPVVTYSAQVSISTDGQTSTIYTVGTDCTFEGDTLTTADGVASLVFSNSGATSVSGTINGADVAGTTPFAPIQPPIFAATYYQQTNATTFTYTPRLLIEADGTVCYAAADDGVWAPVTNYWYDYAMFVVSFVADGKPMTFEMGTAAGWGRVAGNASGGTMLVSIRQDKAVPNL